VLIIKKRGQNEICQSSKQLHPNEICQSSKQLHPNEENLAFEIGIHCQKIEKET